MPSYGVLDRLVRLALTALFVTLAFATPAMPDDVAAKSQALAYLRSLPSGTKIYVWPTRLRPYEIVGVGNTSAVPKTVADYNADHTELSLVSIPLLSPLLSIYIYDDTQAGYFDRFASASKLPDAYKRSLGSHQMDYQGCVFTNLLDRGTWADGGAIFVDESRLPTIDQQRQCIVAGLDYVNGFPTMITFDYRQFPSEEVRRIVVEAVSACSFEGGPAPEQEERTKDGLTPLPDLNCVIGKLSN